MYGVYFNFNTAPNTDFPVLFLGKMGPCVGKTGVQIE